jgi:hypothetical protein
MTGVVIVVVSFRRREADPFQRQLLLEQHPKMQPLIKWNPAHVATLLSYCDALSKTVTTQRVL